MFKTEGIKKKKVGLSAPQPPFSLWGLCPTQMLPFFLQPFLLRHLQLQSSHVPPSVESLVKTPGASTGHF